jgi:glycerate dehydrogenase
MRITKLNHIEYFPEDLEERLNRLGEFVDFDDSPTPELARERLANTDVAIVEWYTPIDRATLQKASSRLRHVVAPLTDYSHIDVEAASELGVTVANCPNTSTTAVAEHLFALLGAVNRKLILADRLVREGKRDYYEPFLATELHGKTLGILGLGHIGKWAAGIGLGFGMRVIGHSRNPRKLDGIVDVDLDELLRSSDVLFVTLPSTSSTQRILSRERLKLMKPSSFLLSISNKELLDEQALFELMESGHIAGAGLDQLEEDSPLVTSDRVVLSPGTAWLTSGTFERLFNTIYENVRSFLDGSPINVVSEK